MKPSPHPTPAPTSASPTNKPLESFLDIPITSDDETNEENEEELQTIDSQTVAHNTSVWIGEGETENKSTTSRDDKADELAESSLADDNSDAADDTTNDTANSSNENEDAEDSVVDIVEIVKEDVEEEGVEDESVEDEGVEEDLEGEEVVAQHLVESKPEGTVARILQIGVAVIAMGVLLIAALLHRSRQRSRCQERSDASSAVAVATMQSRQRGSYDVENGSASEDDDLPQNLEVFKAETTDDRVHLHLATQTSYDQSASLPSAPSYEASITSYGASTTSGEESTVNLWDAISAFTSPYVVKDGTVKTSKRSNKTS